MKHIFHNEVFSIRKLKVGTCSVLLAISILGSQSILADEVGTTTPQIDTKEISNVTTNDLGYSQNICNNDSIGSIDTNSSTNNLDSLSSVNRDNSKDTIHSDSQDNKTVESIEKSNNESKNNKEDIVNDSTIKKNFEKIALNLAENNLVLLLPFRLHDKLDSHFHPAC